MNDIEVVVYTAPWCGPCKVMERSGVYQALEESGAKVTKINVDNNRQLAQQNRIAGVPTFIIKKNGQDRLRFSGAKDKSSFLRQIQGLMQSDDDL